MLEALLEALGGVSFYVYLVVFGIGLAWVAIGLLLGGLESMVDFAHDVADGAEGADSWGHQQVGLSPFSPIMLAVFGMLFGVVGMGLEVFSSWASGWVLLATAVAAVALDAGVYAAIYSFFVKSQSNSLPDTGEAVGSLATVATRIAPGTLGTINYELAGRRVVAGARIDGPEGAQPGDVVRIRSMQGGVARVIKEN